MTSDGNWNRIDRRLFKERKYRGTGLGSCMHLDESGLTRASCLGDREGDKIGNTGQGAASVPHPAPTCHFEAGDSAVNTRTALFSWGSCGVGDRALDNVTAGIRAMK